MERDRISKATHNTIGYLGGENIPAVNHYLAGYVAGARRVDPHIKIMGDYAQSFGDREKGRTIGLSQIGKGADILFQVAAVSGLGYLDAAQERGVYGVGVDASQSYLGPFVITSALKRVDVVINMVSHYAQTGTFRGAQYFYGPQYGATGFATPARVVPSRLIAQAEAYQRQLTAGKIVPPTTVPSH
jgi:basic membrane protein A